MEGLRVLDLSSFYAAPLLAAMLADLGADVVMVEPPGGLGFRASTDLWPLIARRKRSVVIDQSGEQGRAQVRRLIEASDVVVINLPARSAARQFLTWADVSRYAPHVVLVNITGFGDGPAADRPGNGTVSEAFAGLTHLTGMPDGPPLSPSVPLGDAVVAGFGVGGVVAAAWRAARTGRGGPVDIAMYEPLLQVVAPAVTALRDGAEPHGRTGGSLPGSRLRGAFLCGDGKWLAVSASTERHEESIAALVSARPGTPLDGADGPLARWSARRPRDEAVRLLLAERVPVAAVNDAREMLADPHVQARRSFVNLAGDQQGRLLPAPSVRFGDDPRADVPPLPALGSTTSDDVLEEWSKR